MNEAKNKLSVTPVLIVVLLLAISGSFYFFYFEKGGVARISSESSLEFKEADLEPTQDIGFETKDDLADWKAHHFEGQSKSEIRTDDTGAAFLDVQSSGTSTLLLKEANYSVESRPYLSWEWKVAQFPSGKQNKEFGIKQDSDYGARVYVIFKGLTPFTSDTIQYIWDDHFPVGTYRSSPAARHIKLIVVRSGAAEGDGWAKESRDIIKDYEMLFGKRPGSSMHAVGFMSDSDNTRSSSEAQIRNIRVYLPRGLKSEPVSQNPLHAAVYSFGEKFFFLKKANEAGVTLIKESSNNFIGFISKMRETVRRRLFFPRD